MLKSFTEVILLKLNKFLIINLLMRFEECILFFRAYIGPALRFIFIKLKFKLRMHGKKLYDFILRSIPTIF